MKKMNQQLDPWTAEEIEAGIIPYDCSTPCMVHNCEIPVCAGRPLSCLEDRNNKTDMNQDLHVNDETIRFIVSGDSMIGRYIFNGDRLIAQRCNCPENGEIVIAMLNGGATVKEFYRDPVSGDISLIPYNPDFQTIHIDPDKDSFRVSAVVKYIIHKA